MTIQVVHRVLDTLLTFVHTSSFKTKSFGELVETIKTHPAFEQTYLSRDQADYKIKTSFYHRGNPLKEYHVLFQATKGSLNPEDEPVRWQLQYYDNHRIFLKKDQNLIDAEKYELETILNEVHHNNWNLEKTAKQLQHTGFKYVQGGIHYSVLDGNCTLFMKPTDVHGTDVYIQFQLAESKQYPRISSYDLLTLDMRLKEI